MLQQRRLKELAGVLAALIRMKHQACMFTSNLHRHSQRSANQVGVIDQRERPANDSAGEQINDCCQVIPAFTNHQAGNVAAPDLIDCGWLEVTLEQVLGHKCFDASRAILMATALSAGQICLRHEFSGQMPSHFDLLGLQVLRDHPRACTSPAFVMQLHDFCSERVTLGIRR